MYKFTINFLIILLTFFQIIIYLSNIFPSFVIKIHIFSLIRISLLYTHFCKGYAERSNFFIIFVTSKIFKILFSKGNLLDTTISLISISIIKIGHLYWWNSYSWISVSSNFHIFFIHFYLWFIIFLIYNFLLFFRSKFRASKRPYILHQKNVSHYFFK